MNIFLVGFMGSGKSTLGKKIASRLNFLFIDMDVEIEKQEKKSVQEIFQLQGEQHFRAIETDWLKKFENKNAVVATGGGAPCSENNLQLIQQKGITTYLKSSPENLTNRLFQAKNSRPLINQFKHDKNELLHFVQTKLAEREPFYFKSDLIFDSLDINAEKLDEIVKSIVETIAKRISKV